MIKETPIEIFILAWEISFPQSKILQKRYFREIKGQYVSTIDAVKQRIQEWWKRRKHIWYMGIISRPNESNGSYEKTNTAGTIDWGSNAMLSNIQENRFQFEIVKIQKVNSFLTQILFYVWKFANSHFPVQGIFCKSFYANRPRNTRQKVAIM